MDTIVPCFRHAASGIPLPQALPFESTQREVDRWAIYKDMLFFSLLFHFFTDVTGLVPVQLDSRVMVQLYHFMAAIVF